MEVCCLVTDIWMFSLGGVLALMLYSSYHLSQHYTLLYIIIHIIIILLQCQQIFVDMMKSGHHEYGHGHGHHCNMHTCQSIHHIINNQKVFFSLLWSSFMNSVNLFPCNYKLVEGILCILMCVPCILAAGL